MDDLPLHPLSAESADIKTAMQGAYLNYAMSVIVSRALPDVRDGLKPVHRRVLYAMHELGVVHNKPFKKSARIVGDVIGKYHPHGDSAVYDTIVRLAQDFSMRHPLVDGQGNFGSIDGDSAAAMRYTEVRLHRISDEMLRDIDKETVDYGDNYDSTLKEPLVLPTRVPNLLVNGSSGIAVGMATNIPPHNLGEVCDALLHQLEHPDAELSELMKYIKGPDFPTAGIICGKAGILDAYATGRGRIRIRARTEVEEMRGGRQSIIISELPYQVNKARLIEKIAELVKEKRVEGITDLRDESDRNGMRVVIELRKGEFTETILNKLFKFTAMESTFGIINLALVDGRPQELSLPRIIELFIDHRRDVINARTRYELQGALRKAHLLEGLKIAIENLDAVIELIRGSDSGRVAKDQLMQRYELSEEQSQAILDMRLQKLTGLEREKLIRDYEETMALIADLRDILSNEERVRQIIADETRQVRENYANPRRTVIVDSVDEINMEDLIVEEDTVVTITKQGYIKRTPANSYKSQHRGGKGKVGLEIKDGDFVSDIFVCSTHDFLMFFTDRGRVYWLKAWDLPEQGRSSRGKAIVNFVQLEPDEHISTVFPVRDFSAEQYLTFVTRNGLVKKTPLQDYGNIRTKGVNAISLDPDDQLMKVMMTQGEQNLIVATRSGYAIHFSETDVRPTGRTTRGVKAIALAATDFVVSAEVMTDVNHVLTVTDKGYGKRTEHSEYRLQSRGGKGIYTIKTTSKNGLVTRLLQVSDEDEVLLLTSSGKIIRIKSSDIRITGRSTQGVRLVDLAHDDRLIGVALATSDTDEEEEDTQEP